jgi:uncharacterized protein YhbP (UPF0306 family)
MSDGGLAGRTRRLLDEAKYLTVATVSEDGLPWSATLQYAWLSRPPRLLFGSATRSRHSRHIAARPQVSGSLYVAGDDAGAALTSVDGAQFSGRCHELPAEDVRRFHASFYDAVLPDPRARAAWTLPHAALLPPAEHRLYMIEIERWWLLDTRTWAQDRIERRIEVPLAELEAV